LVVPGPQEERARGKQIDPAAAARHSHSPRVHTGNYSWEIHISPDFSQVEPALLSSGSTQFARELSNKIDTHGMEGDLDEQY